MECNGFSFPSTMSSTISIYILSSSFTISCVTSMHMHSMQKIHIITPRWHNIQCMFGIQVMPSIQAPNRTTFKSWISLFRKYEGRLYVAEKSKWVCHVIVSKSSHIKRHLLTTLFMVYLWQLFYIYVIILH